MTTVDKIKNRLVEKLDIIKLEIIDDSAKHADHQHNMGGGHYNAIIISDDFKDKSLIQRHQLVYDALGEMVKQEIHAFSMKTMTKIEVEKLN